MSKVVEGRLGRVFIGKLPYNSDLLQAIKSLAEELDIQAGYFTIIGAVKQAKLRYYDQEKKEYLDFAVEKPLEIASCIGNISKFKGELLIHCHIVLADREGNTYGGHLAPGTRVFAAEIHLQEVAGVVLERAYDEVTGLNLFSL